MRARVDDRARAVFHGDDGKTLTVVYTNRGDPYRQGIQMEMLDAERSTVIYVDLLDHEADQLLECLAKLRGRNLA